MASARPSVLVVDDEAHSVSAMKMALEDEFDILTALDADGARKVLEEEWVQVVICDQRMPGRSGVEFLTDVRENWPETVRIVITGYTDPSAMIQAINDAGVHQFITKPWHPDQLLMATRNAARLFHLARENERMALEMRYLTTTAESRLESRRRALMEGRGFESILRADHSPMNAVVTAARQFAAFDVPVLLTGEAGSGKGEIARAMHLVSLRSDRPWFALNLAGLTDEIAMLELFGAKRGIVPGGSNKIGLLRKADRGTLYLGGIDTISPALQLALWRVVSEGAFSPVGGQETVATAPRIVAGTSRSLAELVAEGKFRGDLYHALSLGDLTVPPLRARNCDIALLAHEQLETLSQRHGKAARGFTPAALEFLENYTWPGNLPELANEIARMLIFAQRPVLGAELLSRHILRAPQGANGHALVDAPPLLAEGTLKDQVEMIETRVLRETLTRHRWNKSRAAAELGLSRVGLRAKLERYGIADPSGRSLGEDEED